MIQVLNPQPKEFENLHKPIQNIFYKGNPELLSKKKISIVGSRKPSSYARNITEQIASTVTYNNKLKSTRINLNGVNYGS